MPDHLHAYNIEVAAARKAHRAAIRLAADLYAQAHADLMTAHELRLANAATAFRMAKAAAEETYNAAEPADYGDAPF